MGRAKARLSDVRIEPLRRLIERWRQTRAKRSPMPEPIWQRAVELAREHGVYATAQALGLSYGSLRTRTEAAAVSPRKADGQRSSADELRRVGRRAGGGDADSGWRRRGSDEPGWTAADGAAPRR